MLERLKEELIQTYKPKPAAQKAYEKLYGEYVRLHHYFAGGANDVMKRLKCSKAETRTA